MLLNVAEIRTIGCYLGIFRLSVLDKYVDDRWFHLGPGSRNVSPRSDLQVVHVSEVPGILDVLMLERHTVSLHLRRGVLFNSSRSLQRPESGEIKMLNRSHSVVVILTIHVDKQWKMKQGPFLAIGRLILYQQWFWEEGVTACWEIGKIGTWTK